MTRDVLLLDRYLNSQLLGGSEANLQRVIPNELQMHERKPDPA